jgi:hypothetical protein
MTDIVGMADSLAQWGRALAWDAEELYRRQAVLSSRERQAPLSEEDADSIAVLCGQMRTLLPLFAEYIELGEAILGRDTTEEDRTRTRRIQ